MSQNPEQTIAELQQKIKSLELQLKKAKDSSGYGLKWEEKPEIFEERAQNALPLLKEDKSLLIDNKSDLDHIIIEWDNYHALSALNYTHKWMIDVIYIDPPYNTGNKDFIYNDNYVDPEDTYRHSKWLSFMNKRLRLARNLLSENGFIFISIDDNEQHNLKLLLLEIFWENNIEELIWQKQWNDNKSIFSWVNTIRNDHENIFVAYKNRSSTILERPTIITEFKNKYWNIDNDPRWNWMSAELWKSDVRSIPTWKNYFTLTSPTWNQWTRQWHFSESEMKKLDKEWKIYRWNWNTVPRLKKFLSEPVKRIPSSLLLDKWSTKIWRQDILDIFWEIVFDYPKPVILIKYLISLESNKDCYVLDFFAWSWTTGQAVLELNKQDWWHRQFILCSNRENTKENPDKNICKDITYERVKRVMEWYTNTKGEKIEWLKWWNLRYYTTEFIEKKKSTDDLRQSFIYLCDELLCIKEDTFNEYKSESLSNKLKCYQKNNHYTVILYDIREIEKLQQLLSTLDGKISVYIFSLSKDSCEEELQEFSEKIKIENIPDDILETYKKIF